MTVFRLSLNSNLARLRSSIVKVAATICVFALTSCNSVFYQPDKLAYSLPQQINPSFEGIRIPVDGTSEQIQIWRFQSRKPRRGTVVHFHGNAQNMSAHVWFAAWLLDAGYELITFDYRGYGESDGIATRENTIKDGHAVLQWAAKQSQSTPLFVLGQSLGGAVAYASLSTLNSSVPVRGLIIESSFISYRQLARRKLASLFLTWPLQWPLSYLVTDDLSPRTLSLKSPLPILFIHGSNDVVVPYSEGLEFAEKAAREKNSVRFYTDVARGHTSCFAGLTDSPCKRDVVEFLDSLTSAAPTATNSNGGRSK